MSDVVIQIQGLGKRYRLGQTVDLSRTFRETLATLPRFFGQKARQAARTLAASRAAARAAAESSDPETPPGTFWALRDVDLEVQQGEVVGIIGRNGAGKSTLLKILSRITTPTKGEALIRGRLASLLEVGTGFHPELTGRENIYLNGAILGMNRFEITRKFDEIVAFAEVEKFIDTPVKRYSSGMYVRLAFSVAAHLEPEIMIVDEVLAVGDAEFQKRCLGRMSDVAREGRTVLFVSHNMAAVLSLCTRACLLEKGRLVLEGPTPNVINEYINRAAKEIDVPLDERTDRKGDGRARLTSVSVRNERGESSLRCGDRLRIALGYRADAALKGAKFLVGVYDHFDRPVFFLDSQSDGGFHAELPATGEIVCLTEPINLTPGPCRVNVAVLLNEFLADHVIGACGFEVESEDFYGTGRLTERKNALCLLRQDWDLGTIDA
ncbi:ABC transporter ATP-binding protein [Candidatus Sumerlaeota bacterium]|nr:ABC transporter ATP-binding protein [Candidatus Sumerlaeota bacterium]